jgi:amidase
VKRETLHALADLPAAKVARLVARREVSPVEVIDAALARVERHNARLNALVTLNPRARDEAKALEKRLKRREKPGVLCGLPVGIKDVTPVAGLRTTYGSPIYKDHVPTDDAVVVERLKAAGAIVLGKTNTPEFAAGGNTWNEVFGRTRNPWDTSKSAGGSTGGGCAALASGMIALAEGTDLGGSLRIPASFCGVVGLRPTLGLVPTHPSGWVWDTLQVSGGVARTAEDVALMLKAVGGASPAAPLGIVGGQRVAAGKGSKRALRLAYCADLAGIGVDPDVERVCREAVMSLEDKRVHVEEIQLDLAFARKAFLALRGLWFLVWMYPLLGQMERLGVNVANNVRSGMRLTTKDLAEAEVARGRLWHLFREFFEKHDHLLTPCMAVPPFPVEQNYPETVAGKPMETYVDWIAPTFVLSLSGLPVASVPAGLDSQRLPVGLQIVGRPLADEAVLAVASAVQKRRPIGKPPLIA